MKTTAKMSEVCPICARLIRLYVPRGGDGSGWFFVFHDGRRKGVRCEGSQREHPPRVNFR